MAGAPGSEDIDQRSPAERAEQADGPWNQPEIQAARQRQSRIKIGELPARAAPIGQPFVRGDRTLRALLITPEPSDSEAGLRRRAAQERAAARRAAGSDGDLDDAGRLDSASVAAGLAVIESPSPAEKTRTGRHGRRWPLIATGVAFVCSVGIPVALHATAPSGSGTSAARPAPVVAAGAPAKLVPAPSLRAQALAWTRSNLPMDSVIVADQSSADSLRTAGFTGAEVFGQVSDVPVATIDFVLSVPSTTATLSGPSGSDTLVAASLPLAAFGSSGEVASVREFFPAGTASVAAREKQDEALRRQGGAELAVNPALVFDRNGEAEVATGGLDLRAQNVLNVLASVSTTYVTLAAPVAAEMRLDRPIRSVTVTTTDPLTMQNALAAMVAPYKPDSITAISDRKFRLTWNPAIAPVLTVG